MTRYLLPLLAIVLTACATPSGFHAATAAATPAPARESPFAPYAFLVGEWNVAPAAGGPAAAVARFRWGTGRSYLWYSVATVAAGGEQPHFEGMLAWNGATRKLDMLLVLDLTGGAVQEQGTMSLDADGTVTRDIVATYARGDRVTFRQTFRAEGPDRIATSLLRRTEAGWVATFPGSERLAMTRRTG